MQATTQPATISSETTDQLITDVSWWGGFISPESAALDAIVLGGKLDVIEDESLRRLLPRGGETWNATSYGDLRFDYQEFEAQYNHF